MKTDEQEAIEEAESRKLDALLRQQRIDTINRQQGEITTLKAQNERLVRALESMLEPNQVIWKAIEAKKEAKALLSEVGK